MHIICTRCEADLSTDYCPACGEPALEELSECPRCGRRADAPAYCPTCGELAPKE